jgi:GAF domain-containing protein
VAQLDWGFPTLRPERDTVDGRGTDEVGHPGPPGSTVSTGTLDLLGILAASQALSSETSIDRLHARVVEVLGALTGATSVHLPLWDEDRQNWLLPTSTGTVPVDGGPGTAVPLSVLRYVQRTGERLSVADATADARFAGDAHLTDADCCSLLAVPILSRGALRAVLVLENRLLRDAFTAERSDAVELIAGQLAVSLDNTQVYASFRRVADEQIGLRRVATLVAQGEPPSTVLAAVAREAGELLSADIVVIGRYRDGPSVTAIVGRAARRPECDVGGLLQRWPGQDRGVFDGVGRPRRVVPRQRRRIGGRRADHGRGTSVGRDHDRARARAPLAARHRRPTRELHRSRGDGDRQRRGARAASRGRGRTGGPAPRGDAGGPRRRS